jgi:hypothetical protein
LNAFSSFRAGLQPNKKIVVKRKKINLKTCFTAV